MFFDKIKTPDETLFKHIPSDRTFVYRCFRAENYLRLSLFEQTTGNKAGFAFVEYRVDRLLRNPAYRDYDNPLYSEGAYGLRSINVPASYRNMSLGALMMFITTGEVLINNGKHLYLVNPIVKALGFYIQFGFHPDPDVAAGRQHHRLERLRPDAHPDADYILAEKILMSKNYFIWRGDINIVMSLLTKKITSLFSFS